MCVLLLRINCSLSNDTDYNMFCNYDNIYYFLYFPYSLTKTMIVQDNDKVLSWLCQMLRFSGTITSFVFQKLRKSVKIELFPFANLSLNIKYLPNA